MTTTPQPLALPLYLARAAWADKSFDDLLDALRAPRRAALVVAGGDPVPALAGLDVTRGPAPLLLRLVQVLRAAAHDPAGESLALLTAAPGDVAAVPPVPGLAAVVTAAGCATLVRDPATRTAVCVTLTEAGPDVLRWEARGITACPVPPQPAGAAEAAGDLSAAVVAAARLIEAAPRVGGAVDLDADHPVTRFPGGLPSRARDLLDRADRVDGIVDLALRLPGAGFAVSEREPVLRRLRSAVDAARRSAVAYSAESLRRIAVELGA